MKTFFKTFAVALMTLSVVCVSAAEKKAKTPEQQAQMAISHITKYVELKAEQVEALTAKFIENAKAKAEATTDEVKKAFTKKQKADIKSVLTPEQYKTYDDACKANAEARKSKAK